MKLLDRVYFVNEVFHSLLFWTDGSRFLRGLLLRADAPLSSLNLPDACSCRRSCNRSVSGRSSSAWLAFGFHFVELALAQHHLGLFQQSFVLLVKLIISEELLRVLKELCRSSWPRRHPLLPRLRTSLASPCAPARTLSKLMGVPATGYESALCFPSFGYRGHWIGPGRAAHVWLRR